MSPIMNFTDQDQRSCRRRFTVRIADLSAKKGHHCAPEADKSAAFIADLLTRSVAAQRRCRSE
jgi:hypothetical protein